MDLITELENKIKDSKRELKIVFPEGDDVRVLKAVARLQKAGVIVPVLVGNPAEVMALAQKNNIDLNRVEIIDPISYPGMDGMIEEFVERRKGKVTKEDAQKLLKDVNYFGTMLVYMGKVDGLVSGAAHSTADTVRPALQIIKTKLGVKRISAAFLMVKDDKRYLFADCAININPDAAALAEIAEVSIGTARLFNIDPKVAMLSFATKGSASSPEVEKVVEATHIAQAAMPGELIDGELQFDAAFVPSVAAKKAPESKVAGHANVFIFPDLNSGNIGYKIAQRMGGFTAIGPILQGMNKPVSDLSRGASADDIFDTALITAAQALALEA